MRAGTDTQTGRDLDIPMQGDALPVVQAENGDEAYTRRGDRHISPSGLLTTGDGHTVQGGQGPVTLPPAHTTTIAQDARGRVVPQACELEKPKAAGRLPPPNPGGTRI